MTKAVGIAHAVSIGGYVLAGGRSSRMGTDKSLLELGGKPLIERAVVRLRGLCVDVHILSRNPALAAYAPLLADIHADCGPIGGMESALQHSPHAWNLFLSVDMPFLPAAWMRGWVSRWMQEGDTARIRIFEADGRPQPGFCLLHKDVLPVLTESILKGEYRLMCAFEMAARHLAIERGVAPGSIFWRHAIEADSFAEPVPGESQSPTQTAQLAARHLWFANVNTPEEFADAATYLEALDD